MAALAVVVATAAVVGAAPFLDGLAAVSPWTIVAAVALAAIATAAAAWRWRMVSTGFGLPLAWSDAFAAYYRSQFLNMVLPGGVVGDVQRAYVQGRVHDRLDLAARAVAAERIAGQLVQLVLTLAILLPLGLTSPLAPLAWISGAVALLLLVGVAAVALSARGRAALVREYRMLRPVLSRPLTLLAITAASAVVLAAHAATFVVAGLAAGVHADPAELAIVAPDRARGCGDPAQRRRLGAARGRRRRGVRPRGAGCRPPASPSPRRSACSRWSPSHRAPSALLADRFRSSRRRSMIERRRPV